MALKLNFMGVAAMILAAGASRRLGQPKQLLMQSNETLLARCMRLAEECGAAPVMVVVGANRDAIQAAVCLDSAIAVKNEDWERGLSSSIKVGLAAVEFHSPDADGVLILGCDQPKLNGDHLRSLMDAFLTHAAKAIICSHYAGINGIPAIFPRASFVELAALEGDKGARALLMRPSRPLISIPFPGGEIDIDRPADLAHLEE